MNREQTTRTQWQEYYRTGRRMRRYLRESESEPVSSLYLGAWLRSETHWSSLDTTKSTTRGLGIMLGWRRVSWRIDDSVLLHFRAAMDLDDYVCHVEACDVEILRRKRSNIYRWTSALRRSFVNWVEKA